ncbi:Non-structural protein 1, partial [Frankliniella fusca]
EYHPSPSAENATMEDASTAIGEDFSIQLEHNPATPLIGSRESFSARVRSSSPPSRSSLKKPCESAGVRAISPQKQQLAKTAREYRQMAFQFRRKLEIAWRRCSSLSKLASTRFVDMVDELTISLLTKQTVKSEMVNMKRHKSRRTWTVNDKLSALSIYKR